MKELDTSKPLALRNNHNVKSVEFIRDMMLQRNGCDNRLVWMKIFLVTYISGKKYVFKRRLDGKQYGHVELDSDVINVEQSKEREAVS